MSSKSAGNDTPRHSLVRLALQLKLHLQIKLEFKKQSTSSSANCLLGSTWLQFVPVFRLEKETEPVH